MKIYFYIVLSLVLITDLKAQKYTSEKGHIIFFSDATIEDIKAENNLVGSLYNASNGELVFIVKIKDFRFEKSLMREHFNEKYMETEKFPKSTFQGKIIGGKNGLLGLQHVKAKGKLTIHGVTKEIEVPGSLEFVNGKVTLKSVFMIKLQDYNIKIPQVIWQNLAEEVEVKIEFTYKSI